MLGVFLNISWVFAYGFVTNSCPDARSSIANFLNVSHQVFVE